MKKYFLLLLTFLLFACSNSTEPVKELPDLNTYNEIIPLKIGNAWKYKESGYYWDFLQSFMFIDSIRGKNEYECYYKEELANNYLGKYVCYIINSYSEVWSANNEYYYHGYAEKTGKVIFDNRIPKNPQIGNYYHFSGFDFLYTGREDIETTSGTFTDCDVFLYNSENKIYYKRNIGLVLAASVNGKKELSHYDLK